MTNPLTAFDFAELDSPDFKEDSVREEIINPLLNSLGYSVSGTGRIRRSKALKHPFVQVGSGKRRITVVPDYLLEVKGRVEWVLDAKSPTEEIKSGENVEQAFFYAIHPDIRAKLYALCNGKEFIVFAIDHATPILYFHTSEIEQHLGKLTALLSEEAFSDPAPVVIADYTEAIKFDYVAAKLLTEIKAQKQAAKRHFGVHGYFTRQAWDVVQAYIKNFTKPGDLVLDPFGGYGVTLLEALVLGRKAIHIDLNPLSVFIIEGLVAPVTPADLWSELGRIEEEFHRLQPKSPAQVKAALRKYPHPSGAKLSKDADVLTVGELFTEAQLSELGLLKHLILRTKDEDIRRSLMLAFSSTITKINRTYHPSKSRGDNAGDSAAFRYYRYRIAPQSVKLIPSRPLSLK